MSNITWYFDASSGAMRQTPGVTQAEWYVDPVNGSDENDGTSAVNALKTVAQIFVRYGTTTPTLNQATTFWILNSTLPSDAWRYKILLGPAGSLSVQAPLGGATGTPALIATLAAYAAVNPVNGVNARATITVTGQSWTPYIGNNCIAIGYSASNPTVPAYQFHLGSDLGSGVAAIDTPFKILSIETFPGIYAAPAEGDTIKIYAQPTLYVDDANANIAEFFQFTNLNIQSSSGGAIYIRSEIFFFGCTFNACSIQTPGTNEEVYPYFIGCHFSSNANYQGLGGFWGCGLDGEGVYLGGCSFDGDTWIAFRMHMGSSGVLYLRRVGFGQINDVDVGGPIWQLNPTDYVGQGLVTAVYGAGIHVFGSASMRNLSGLPYATAMAGLETLLLNESTNACAWNGSGFAASAPFTPSSCDVASQWAVQGSGAYIAVTGQ
jgi:hypothetical protein